MLMLALASYPGSFLHTGKRNLFTRLMLGKRNLGMRLMLGKRNLGTRLMLASQCSTFI